MSQVSLNAPPVPALPYQPNQHAPDYPPSPQPQYGNVPSRGTYAYPDRPHGSPRDPSLAGFSMAREKMMKRRVSRAIFELLLLASSNFSVAREADWDALPLFTTNHVTPIVCSQGRPARRKPCPRCRCALAHCRQWSHERRNDQDEVHGSNMRPR